jgi:hypothetical protein
MRDLVSRKSYYLLKVTRLLAQVVGYREKIVMQVVLGGWYLHKRSRLACKTFKLLDRKY